MAGTFIYQELPPKERIIAMSKICLRKEDFAFTVSLTEEELNAEKDTFARAHMRKDQLQDELKMEQNRIKAEIKKVDEEAEKTLEVITMEQRKRQEEVFLIPDHTTNTVAYVTKAGEVVHTRQMAASEKQGRLFNGDAQQPDVIVEAVTSSETEADTDADQNAEEVSEWGELEGKENDKPEAWHTAWNDHISGQLNMLDGESAKKADERLDYLKTMRFDIVDDGETYEYVNGNKLTWGDVRDLNDDEWDFILTDVMGPQEDPDEPTEQAQIISARVEQLRELGYEPDEFGYRKGEQLITHRQFQESSTDEWYQLTGIEPKGELETSVDLNEQEPVTAFYNPAAIEENPKQKKRTNKKKATDEKPSDNN
jgi:hypothetical protein